MSYWDVTPKHRAGSGPVVYRTAVSTSITDPSAIPALRRANRRLRLRRLGYDAAIGALSGLAVLMLVLLGLWAVTV